jgi:hypothetical protein
MQGLGQVGRSRVAPEASSEYFCTSVHPGPGQLRQHRRSPGPGPDRGPNRRQRTPPRRVLAALSAGVWFDFFLTRPYERFAINDRADIDTPAASGRCGRHRAGPSGDVGSRPRSAATPDTWPASTPPPNPSPPTGPPSALVTRVLRPADPSTAAEQLRVRLRHRRHGRTAPAPAPRRAAPMGRRHRGRRPRQPTCGPGDRAARPQPQRLPRTIPAHPRPPMAAGPRLPLRTEIDIPLADKGQPARTSRRKRSTSLCSSLRPNGSHEVGVGF